MSLFSNYLPLLPALNTLPLNWSIIKCSFGVGGLFIVYSIIVLRIDSHIFEFFRAWKFNLQQIGAYSYKCFQVTTNINKIELFISFPMDRQRVNYVFLSNGASLDSFSKIFMYLDHISSNGIITFWICRRSCSYFSLSSFEIDSFSHSSNLCALNCWVKCPIHIMKNSIIVHI